MSIPFRGTPGPQFAPTQISGCAVWLDAFRVNGTSLATEGSAVSSWVNLVGGGSNFTQATPTRQPTFLQNGLSTGYPSVYFNSSNTAASIQYLFAGPNVQTTRDASFFYVSRYTDVGNANQTQIDQRKDVTGTALRTFKATQYQLRDPAGNLYSLDYTANTSPSIKSYRDTLNASFGYFNGTQVTSSTGAYNQQVADNYGILIGGHFGADTDNGVAALTFAKVYFSEILIYNRFLTLGEQEQVEGYLAWKWGLQANLPSNHPYATTPVYSATIVPFPPTLRATVPYAVNGSIFNPTTIPGCQIWLDGADPNGNGIIPTNGTSLPRWVNKGPASLSLSNPSTAPTYMANFQNGLGSVSFNNSYFQAPYSFNLSAKSVFLVCSQSNNSVDSPQGILSFYGAGNDTVASTNGFGYQASQSGFTSFGWLYNIFQSGVGAPSPSTGYYITFGTPGALTPISMYESVLSSQYEQAFVNGINNSNFTITTTPGTATTLQVGARFIGGTLRGVFYGNICEIIIYSVGIQPAQRQQIEGYLAWKWGLVSSLPTGHPYKTPPLVPFPPATIPRRVRGGLFVPTQISGCQLWLDAADSSTVTTSGGFVTSVREKSSNARVLSNGSGFTYNQTPFNGSYPSFFSSGAAADAAVGVNASFSLSQPLVVFFVGQPTFGSNAGVFPYLADSTNSGSRIALYYWANNGFRTRMFAGSEIEYIGTSSAPFLHSYIADTTSSVIFTNGTSQVTGSIGSGTFSGITIGNAFSRGSSQVWIGHICEGIIYSGNLTTSQRQQLEGYLAWKWGLQGSLPFTHPFRLFPPAPS